MHRTGGVKVALVGFGGDDNPSSLRLRDIVSEGFRDPVKGQGPVSQTTNKREAAHLLLPVGADCAIRPAAMPGHRSPRTNSGCGDVGAKVLSLPADCFFSRELSRRSR